MIKTEWTEEIEFNKAITDLLKRDQVINRINTYLRDAPLNIGKDEYCYVKIVGNHLEIGRAKIILEE
jgi:hypothetical protein